MWRPAGAGRTYPRALGRSRAAVRAHYGALPLCRLDGCGRRLAKAGRMTGLARAQYPEVRPREQKSPRWRAHRRRDPSRGGSRLLAPPPRLSARRSPHLRGETASHLGRIVPRERGGAVSELQSQRGCLTCESGRRDAQTPTCFLSPGDAGASLRTPCSASSRFSLNVRFIATAWR